MRFRGPSRSGAVGNVSRDFSQVDCWLTYTTARDPLERSGENLAPVSALLRRDRRARTALLPVDRGQGGPVSGARQHQVFVEPEGLDTDWTYLNGLSMSLPAEVQEEIVRSLPGLERAEILRPAYAVEYDVVFPEQLDDTLEVRALSGLFLAGQINGTSGYEEAAGQGLVAGVERRARVAGAGTTSRSRSDATRPTSA